MTTFFTALPRRNGLRADTFDLLPAVANEIPFSPLACSVGFVVEGEWGSRPLTRSISPSVYGHVGATPFFRLPRWVSLSKALCREAGDPDR